METLPRQFFDETKNALANLSGESIRVVLSSLGSYQYFSVFGKRYQTLDRYDYMVTAEEAALLAGALLAKQPTVQISAEDLDGLPFQVAAEKIFGKEVQLPKLAKVCQR